MTKRTHDAIDLTDTDTRDSVTKSRIEVESDEVQNSLPFKIPQPIYILGKPESFQPGPTYGLSSGIVSVPFRTCSREIFVKRRYRLCGKIADYNIKIGDTKNYYCKDCFCEKGKSGYFTIEITDMRNVPTYQ